MSKEGLKPTKASSTDTELLEAEVTGNKVTIEVNGVSLEVNPKAAGSGPALRELQQRRNIWPMYDLLVPDREKQEELEATLPQDEEFGWDLEDFAEMFNDLFGQASGKKV